MLESLFKYILEVDILQNNCSYPQNCNFIKNRLQHRCFLVINVKFLGTSFLKDICKWLLLKIYRVLLFWFLEGIL